MTPPRPCDFALAVTREIQRTGGDLVVNRHDSRVAVSKISVSVVFVLRRISKAGGGGRC
jgi:hypothetical protein